MLKNIRIRGLFNQFDYDIELKREGITLLTGPNGYGKTTILNILHALSMRNMAFFFTLPFAGVWLTLEEEKIEIAKRSEDEIEIRSGDGDPLSLKRGDISADGPDHLPDNKSRHIKQILNLLNVRLIRDQIPINGKNLSVFDARPQQIQLFSTILNERLFAGKKLEISADFCFRFLTEDGKELSLTDLSSGERREVALIYELLFKVKPGTLVLIDEPEISLHVAWQKKLLDDLMKIIELQKIDIIGATHSPHIIGKHWDLVVDLERNC